MELERDLEVAGRVLAVGVHVDVREAHARAGAQELAGVGIEDVGVAPDFVDGPAAAERRRRRCSAAPGAEHAHDRVVEDEQPADGRRRPAACRCESLTSLISTAAT